jgi:hypothetical protein
VSTSRGGRPDDPKARQAARGSPSADAPDPDATNDDADLPALPDDDDAPGFDEVTRVGGLSASDAGELLRFEERSDSADGDGLRLDDDKTQVTALPPGVFEPDPLRVQLEDAVISDGDLDDDPTGAFDHTKHAPAPPAARPAPATSREGPAAKGPTAPGFVGPPRTGASTSGANAAAPGFMPSPPKSSAANPASTSGPNSTAPGFAQAPKSSANNIVGATPRAIGILDPSVRTADGEVSGRTARPKTSVPEASTSAPRARPTRALDPRTVRRAAAIGAAVVVLVLAVQLPRWLAARGGDDPLAGEVDVWGGELGYMGVTSYVQRVTDRVAAHVDGLRGPLRVQISKDKRASAFGAPGGRIVVSVGALRRLRTEAELGALVAHLAAHHALGHVDAAFAHEVPQVAVARPFKADQEAKVNALVAQALTRGAFPGRAYADVFDRFGKKGVGTTKWPELHPIPADDLRELRAALGGGRVGQVDYELNVLDKIGRSASR